jgi:hypothetical protein
MIDVDVRLGENETDASDDLGAIMATCGVETNKEGEEFVELPGATCGFHCSNLLQLQLLFCFLREDIS